MASTKVKKETPQDAMTKLWEVLGKEKIDPPANSITVLDLATKRGISTDRASHVLLAKYQKGILDRVCMGSRYYYFLKETQ